MHYKATAIFRMAGLIKAGTLRAGRQMGDRLVAVIFVMAGSVRAGLLRVVSPMAGRLIVVISEMLRSVRAGPVRVVSPRAGIHMLGPFMAVTFAVVSFMATRLVESPTDSHLVEAFMRRLAV